MVKGLRSVQAEQAAAEKPKDEEADCASRNYGSSTGKSVRPKGRNESTEVFGSGSLRDSRSQEMARLHRLPNDSR